MIIKTNRFLRFVISLAAFGMILAGAHYLVIQVLPANLRVDGVPVMHIFLFVLTALFYLGMIFLLGKKREFMGYGFMAASLFKMLISILFLLPRILDKQPDTKCYVFQFFGLYFLYLVFEVIVLAKDLKESKPETQDKKQAEII